MPVRRTSYHHGDLRRALLQSAAELVADQGVQATSLREVARRAGVSHAAPAHHFGDKAGLLAALAAEGHRLLGEALIAADDHSVPPAEALARLGSAYLGCAARHPGHFAVMARCDLFDPEAHPELLRHATANHVRLLAVVARARTPERDDVHAFAALADAAWGTAHGLASLLVGRVMTFEQAESAVRASAMRLLR